MIVITADQVDSRSTADLATDTLAMLNTDFARGLLLSADRTAGDEIQLLVRDGRTAVDVVLALTRAGRWSVGLGVGSVREPLGSSIRESTGDAFVAARSAVDRAKKKATRFAAAAEPRRTEAHDLEALVDLLLILRARRSEQGWEIHDLVTRGLTQADAASAIGITPQSASKRARAAELRAEDAAIEPLSRLVDTLDSAYPALQEDAR
ncbi:hypothetical protein ABIE21_001734 [Conyzicola nivalis]|uniref:DNA-binding protein n=1 Tax=Conyzicola nivalis TaxID=1477021 RepID=A0ABV2QME2_9MICO